MNGEFREVSVSRVIVDKKVVALADLDKTLNDIKAEGVDPTSIRVSVHPGPASEAAAPTQS